ncbi:cytochrome b5 family heme steroid binding domain-containing protein [Cystoisospora suis]|uniref:Cytochrome b5 family heme steroid binding domain-containing protein n=1 Tax=Cystoisospora suis TaxID=483139 RepID=A0A2C6KMF0_9APIC|nr:cytochrome b5 family heme steroid binding domain-containing protein [Cystoisospora suis]
MATPTTTQQTAGSGKVGEEEKWRSQIYTMNEINKHNTEKDYWCVIGGVVYDLTEFLEDHPGGVEVLMDYAGQDATDAFEDIGHSYSARKMAADYAIGVLDGWQGKARGCASKTCPTSQTCCTPKKSCDSTGGGQLVGTGVAAGAVIALAAMAIYYLLTVP